MTNWKPFASVAALVLFFPPSHAYADYDQLRYKLNPVCEQIKKILTARKWQEISLDEIQAPKNSSSGPAIGLVLKEELTRVGLTVKTKANVHLSGRYLLDTSEDPNTKMKVQAISLMLKLTDPLGKPIADFTAEICVIKEREVLQLIGGTLELNPTDDDAKRDRDVQNGIRKPVPVKLGTKIYAREKGTFAVEVLVNGKPVDANLIEGNPFVPLKKGQSYEVRIYNDNPFEAAAQVSIDGLNMFTFSDARIPTGAKKGRPAYEFVVIPPKKSITISGWFQNADQSNAFEVMAYPESEAYKLGQTAKIGTISVNFSASWDKLENRPKDEPSHKSPDIGTGQGAEFKQKYEFVKRDVGQIRSVISIRYGQP